MAMCINYRGNKDDLTIAEPPWADENPAQKNDFQPLIVDRFYSGRSDIYVGR